ncbi:MAG: hypothetical protein U9N86_09310, partial [Bacteroidota bacterium]|nr:hypothetical protein [Bacteroidota bacterium]
LYSQLGKGEWVQLRDKIPVTEYAKLVDSFTAEGFSPEQITETAISEYCRHLVRSNYGGIFDSAYVSDQLHLCIGEKFISPCTDLF